MNTKINQSEVTQKKLKLLALQKEYLEKSIHKLDEIIRMSQELQEMNDPDLIKTYCKKIDEIDAEIEYDYNVACKIEKHLQ